MDDAMMSPLPAVLGVARLSLGLDIEPGHHQAHVCARAAGARGVDLDGDLRRGGRGRAGARGRVARGLGLAGCDACTLVRMSVKSRTRDMKAVLCLPLIYGGFSVAVLP